MFFRFGDRVGCLFVYTADEEFSYLLPCRPDLRRAIARLYKISVYQYNSRLCRNVALPRLMPGGNRKPKNISSFICRSYLRRVVARLYKISVHQYNSRLCRDVALPRLMPGGNRKPKYISSFICRSYLRRAVARLYKCGGIIL